MTTNWKRSAKPRANLPLLPLLPLIFCACTSPQTPVSIAFSASWHGKPVGCDSAELALTDLRFFVSQLVVTDASGGEHDLRLTPDKQWQQADIALIDLESGAGNCENGTEQTNSRLTGTTTATEVVGAKFEVGVPFGMNHNDPLQARSPLNVAAMHWHWRSGYKFLRAGVATPSDGFWMHLGSTGCEGTVQNITGCAAGNRVLVELANVSSGNIRVDVDLARLFADVDLNDNTPGDCSSGPAEISCAEPFNALGLAFGETETTNEQSVFGLKQ